jgi:hypothetical protein
VTPATTGGRPEALEQARHQVRQMLTGSASFRNLPPDEQARIARHTVDIAAYLAEPEGMRVLAPALAGATAVAGTGDPYAFGMADGLPLSSTRSRTGGGRPDGTFVAQGAREGAAVAGVLLTQVSFPAFVAQLVQGVFHAIVTSSIEQMEAYGKLVADVAKTLNQFRDENVTANQGRDHLIEQFPDLFALDVDTGADGAGPRVRMRENVDDRQAAQRVSASMPIDGEPLTSLDDETIEERLVPAARTQLATSRQQLLATMVMMGINRIVVTDGRIQAKVLYDFQARDNFRRQLSATRFDYGDQYAYTSEGEYDTQYEGAERSRSKDSSEERGASYYAKGKYKNTAQPVLTLASATNETTDAALTTKASLAGTVDINFKSDYFPLEKMADSFQISRIQDAAKPGSTAPPRSVAATAGPASPASGPAPGAGGPARQ